MYRSPERSPQDSRDGFFLYSTQASFSWPHVDLAWLLRQAYSRSVWIISFEFVKVCGIRFSIWESFIGFYICCYSISTILACLLSVGVRISQKKLCRMRACWRKWHLVSPTLYLKIPKISPGACLFQRPFLRGLFLEEVIFGGAYQRKEICVSKSIGLALQLEVN